MNAIISKWGNSAALRLPAGVLSSAGIKTGDKVEVVVNADKTITVLPVRKAKKNLAELLAKITPDNLPDYSGLDDMPQGSEIW